MTLVRRRVSPKVRYEVGVPDAVVVLGGEPQVGGQALPVGGQALHRRGVGGAVPGGQLADPRVDDLHELGPGGRW